MNNLFKVAIVRMEESSGNVQFFLRALRTDCTEFSLEKTGVLEYSCYQTKQGLSINECIDRAVFEAQFLLRFFDLPKTSLELHMFSENNIKQARLNRGYEDIVGYNIQPNEYKYFGKNWK